MLEIKKSIEQGFGAGGLYDILKQLQQLGIGIQGEVYFVDPITGSDSSDPDWGKSWEKAYKTILFASAICDAMQTASYLAGTSQARSRHTILLRGCFTESCTDFADRTDYIGIGSVDAEPRARIYGAQAATSVGGARFFNLEFMNTAASAIFTFTTCQGIGFHDCVFTAQGIAATGTSYASYGVRFLGAEGSNYVFKNCLFRPRSNSGKFSTAAISIENTHMWNLLIQDCIVDGTIALNIDTAEVYQGYVRNSLFIATTYCVDDESNDVYYDGCKFISAVDNTTNNDTIVDWNVAKAADCQVTGSNHTDNLPAQAA